MTFIAGCRRINSVHIIADSVITIESANTNIPLPENQTPKTSVFGEQHINEKDRQIHSMGLKIIRVSDRITAAFAGNVNLATSILHDLKIRVDTSSDYVESQIANLLRDYGNPDEVSFIFGIQGSDETLLLSYNDRITASKEITRVDFTYAGNTDEKFNAMFGNAMDTIQGINVELSDDAYLAFICSFMQSLTVQYYILEKGFGGTFLGIYMNSQQVTWLKDILYFIYSNHTPDCDGQDIRLVQIRILPDNSVLKICSNSGSDVAHTFELNRQDSFMPHDFEVEITEEMLNDYQFLAFLNSSIHKILLLGRKAIEFARSNGTLRIEYKSMDLKFTWDRTL